MCWGDFMSEDNINELYNQIDCTRDRNIERLTEIYKKTGLLVDKPIHTWQFEEKMRYDKQVKLIMDMADKNKMEICKLRNSTL